MICPRCDHITFDPPATSRRDNKTKICRQCGELEAIEDMFDALAQKIGIAHYTGPKYWEDTVAKVFHKISIEIEDEKVRAMLKGFNIPVTDDNIEELLDYVQEDFDEDLELNLENCASRLADDLGIEPPGD